MIEVLKKYFPNLSEQQLATYEKLIPVYESWNSKINVISRKDIDNLLEHHILHSLAIAQTINFPDNAKVLDVGTGGGFPGVPLAIMFPQADFTLIDSIGKKLLVADAAIKSAELKNAKTIHRNAIEEKDKYTPFSGGYFDPSFPERVKKLVEKLGQAWDNDPRVAYVEMGIFGEW